MPISLLREFIKSNITESFEEKLPPPESNPNPNDYPELASLNSFIQFLKDDERNTFTAREMQLVSFFTKTSHLKIKTTLESQGFKLQKKRHQTYKRGFKRGAGNDRWYGPGSGQGHGKDDIIWTDRWRKSEDDEGHGQ